MQPVYSQDSFINPLAWVNTTVYDFKNHLKSGAITLYMWTYAEDMQNDDLLHPLGTVVSNPNVEHSTAVMLTFNSYFPEGSVVYPDMAKVNEQMIFFTFSTFRYPSKSYIFCPIIAFQEH